MIEIGVARGQHEDRHVVTRRSSRQMVKTILAGQQQVEQHEARLLARESFDRAIAALFDRDAQPVLFEIGGGQLGEAGVVFDEQNVDAGARS